MTIGVRNPTFCGRRSHDQNILNKEDFGAIIAFLPSMEINLTNRVHIDAPAGIIDIEGEKEFVEGLLSKLFPLIEEAGFGSKPQRATDPLPNEDDADAGQEVEAADDAAKNVKPKAKRKRSVAPKGHTCADRIIALKDDGFFKTKRSAGDIVTGLAEKGFTHQSNQVSAAGESPFKRGMLQRTKEGTGPFKYFWDRE